MVVPMTTHAGANFDPVELTDEQQLTLLSMASEQLGKRFQREEFVELMLDLFEDIPGFEVMPFTRVTGTINHPVSYTHLTLPTTPYV